MALGARMPAWWKVPPVPVKARGGMVTVSQTIGECSHRQARRGRYAHSYSDGRPGREQGHGIQTIPRPCASRH